MFEGKNLNWDEIDTTEQEYKKLPANGYVIRITGAEDDQVHEKLIITFDIAEGEYANYFTEDAYRAERPYLHQFYVSYKEKAMGLFKRFFECVEKSNSWKWDGHTESLFIGKVMGIVLAEEEYLGNDGQVKTRFSRLVDYKTVEQIRTGDFKVKPTKKLEEQNNPNSAEYIPF